MDCPTKAVLLVIDKESVVSSAVWPYLSTLSMPDGTRPFALVPYVIVNDPFWFSCNLQPLFQNHLYTLFVVPLKSLQLLEFLFNYAIFNLTADVFTSGVDEKIWIRNDLVEPTAS